MAGSDQATLRLINRLNLTNPGDHYVKIRQRLYQFLHQRSNAHMLAFGFGPVKLFGIIGKHRTNVQLLPVDKQIDHLVLFIRVARCASRMLTQQATRLFFDQL